MIYISQGYEGSIGLEVLLKSFAFLDANSQKFFTLCSYPDALVQTLNSLGVHYQMSGNTLHYLNCKINLLMPTKDGPQTSGSLFLILSKIQSSDILLTLPSRKDQFIYKNKKHSGHTEFFRMFFNDLNVSMVFKSPETNLLLLTDHLPLKSVASIITEDMIIKKVSLTLKSHSKYFDKIGQVVFAGINPHAGENGEFGSEETQITNAATKLRRSFKDTQFIGPVAGDTLHLYQSPKTLIVSMFHDQGLSYFKSINKFIGLNVSFGLPFLRMSVDHGTAEELYQANQANFLGCRYMLQEALKIQAGTAPHE